MTRARFFLAAAIALLLAAPASAQQPTAKAGDVLGLDYLDTNLASAQVTSFQWCFDATTPCLSSTPAASKLLSVNPPPPAGTSTYGVPIPTIFVVGSVHSVVAKACNAGGCSSGANPFTFVWTIAPPAANPTNTRVLPGP